MFDFGRVGGKTAGFTTDAFEAPPPITSVKRRLMMDLGIWWLVLFGLLLCERLGFELVVDVTDFFFADFGGKAGYWCFIGGC